MISFIVPAQNEEAWVGRCVSAIRSGLEPLAEPNQIIVVDDASDDATALIARRQGAQVIRVEHRQIAATRNAGARQARGDILFFVDADTLVNATAIQPALRSVRAGAVGGGSLPRFESVITSGRKLREHSFMSYAKLFMRLTLLGSSGVRSRQGLEFWYGPEREKAERFMTMYYGA